MKPGKIGAAGFVDLKTRVGGFAYSGGASTDIDQWIDQWVKHIDVKAHKPA